MRMNSSGTGTKGGVLVDSGSGIRSFNMATHLKAPDGGSQFLPLIDLLCIALFFGLLFTRLVVAPGVQISLPQSELRMPQSKGQVAVLTIQNSSMLLFSGGVYQAEGIETAFRERVSRAGDAPITLLIKASGQLPLQSLLDICAQAEGAGFSQIDLAANKTPSTDSDLIESSAQQLMDYNFLNQ